MSQKGFANITLIMVFVAIIVAGGYFVLTREQKSGTQQTIPPRATTQNPTSQQPPPTPTNETVNWRIYVSEVGGWEIRSPKTYTALCGRIRDALCPVKDKVTVPYAELFLNNESKAFYFHIASPQEKPAGLSIVDFAKMLEAQQPEFSKTQTSYMELLLNGYKTIRAETASKGSSKAAYIYFIERDKTTYAHIVVTLIKPEEAKNKSAEIESIVASFRFTK